MILSSNTNHLSNSTLIHSSLILEWNYPSIFFITFHSIVYLYLQHSSNFDLCPPPSWYLPLHSIIVIITVSVLKLSTSNIASLWLYRNPFPSPIYITQVSAMHHFLGKTGSRSQEWIFGDYFSLSPKFSQIPNFRFSVERSLSVTT